MSKAFTKEQTDTDHADDDSSTPALPAGTKNYITPAGFAALQNELHNLVDIERPSVVETVHWAASNGDRSENGDYLYGKKRLREIDRRIRFLVKRLENAAVCDPALHHGKTQIFFGATVTYASANGVPRTVRIVGIDEADSSRGDVSWISPIARTLIKADEGDRLRLSTPAGIEEIEVITVRYPAPQEGAMAHNSRG
ncbi:transcription elongation factor GreB [Candidatus Symbiobacter mobilis]|uniref:Transcription elongation factor GreB n=1 Tax=Candidatus Symbiobacter mobilis CR TaxID=946483 RepID=U5N5G3_9BURK|nr:transcription elongation factor GreB [Candidatus Symbiobacter mobilis]AGX86500.1 transcription elongation factor GreB [Candidatus Symbiobacter mobilis CR]